MKNIMFLTSSMNRGGAERVISILAEHYRKKGYGVAIIQLLHNKNGYELHPDIEVVDCSNDKIHPKLDIPRLVLALRKEFKKRKPTAIVSFISQNCIVAHYARMGLPYHMVCSERIDPFAVNYGRVFQWLLNKAYSKCGKTVLQTERAYRYFPQKVQKNSVIIPNPISVRAYASKIKEPKIVTAGRLAPQKNQMMLIEAFAELHRKHPEYRLEIYGEGPLEGALQQRVEELQLSDAVTLCGNVLDLHEQMATAEMFVLPSDYEGLSNALMEAMMMGLPCISTDCSGSDEIISDGENGLIVPVGDQKKLLLAMERLADDKDYAKQLGANAAASAERYSTKNVLRQWEKVIELDAAEEQA